MDYKEGERMIVSEATQRALTEIIGMCFKENRYLDRMVSIIGVKFAYNTTANLIHHGIAHYFPALADTIGEKCLERYNIPVYYEATPSGGQDYGSVKEAIDDLEERMIDFQSALMGVCRIAQNNGDIHVYVDMLDVLEDFNEIVEQAILLGDKIAIYGDKPSFDRHITSFWILGNDD